MRIFRNTVWCVLPICLGSEFICDLYLAPSTVPNLGRGIFAGRNFAKDEILEVSVTLAMRHDDIESTMLNNYVFDTEERGISMVEFGPGSIYNHKLPTNYHRLWDEDRLATPLLFADQTQPYSTYSGIKDLAVRDLQAGEEIFGKYCEEEGSCPWFEQRGIEFTEFNRPESEPTASRSIEQLAAEGHCMTQVHVEPSTLPQAGRGLFASRRFAKGEIVTISPLLLLRSEHIDTGVGGDYSVLMNYCMSVPDSSVALLQFGLSALANHAPAPAPSSSPVPVFAANMKPEWFYWDEFVESTPSAIDANKHTNGVDIGGQAGHTERTKIRDMVLNTTLLELAQRPFTQLDLAFRATRDIEPDEELFYSYGTDWEAAWEAYAQANTQPLKNKPVRFRSFIGDPEGLFFPHWLDVLDDTAAETNIHQRDLENVEQGGNIEGGIAQTAGGNWPKSKQMPELTPQQDMNTTSTGGLSFPWGFGSLSDAFASLFSLSTSDVGANLPLLFAAALFGILLVYIVRLAITRGASSSSSSTSSSTGQRKVKQR